MEMGVSVFDPLIYHVLRVTYCSLGEDGIKNLSKPMDWTYSLMGRGLVWTRRINRVVRDLFLLKMLYGLSRGKVVSFIWAEAGIWVYSTKSWILLDWVLLIVRGGKDIEEDNLVGTKVAAEGVVVVFAIFEKFLPSKPV